MISTYKYIDTLTNLADLLEKMTIELMKNQMDAYNSDVSSLSKLLMLCFPEIIISYSDPLLSDVAEDASYWSAQLERIVSTLNQSDKFNKIDVLYQETRTNLLSYIDMIKDTPLAIKEISETIE